MEIRRLDKIEDIISVLISNSSFRESTFSHYCTFLEVRHARFHLPKSVFLIESFFSG